MPKRVSNRSKATAVGAGAGLAGSVATYVSMRYGVPLELTMPAVTAGVAWLARWASKLDPHG